MSTGKVGAFALLVVAAALTACDSETGSIEGAVTSASASSICLRETSASETLCYTPESAKQVEGIAPGACVRVTFGRFEAPGRVKSIETVDCP